MIFSDDKNSYYVYVYLRKSDLTPYYVGKGCHGRAFAKAHNVKVPLDKSRIIFVETNLTNIGACAIERRLISWYGRKDLGTGILRNLTDGGDRGTAGLKHSKTTRLKISLSNRGKKMSAEAVEKTAAAKRGKRLIHSASFVAGERPLNLKYRLNVTTPGGNVSHYETVSDYEKTSGHKQRNIYYLANMYPNIPVQRGKFKGYIFYLEMFY